MDIQPQSTQPISDDQELAKVLAGVNAGSDDATASSAATEHEVAVPTPAGPPPAASVADDAADAPVVPPAPDPVEPAESPIPPAVEPVVMPPAAIPGTEGLDGVKKDAINELRPLVDKLNLAPEEKFDTYLLLIRSTDDKTLIAPAHEAAKQIGDETRKAQALLDIIKEIDFLSGPQQPQA